jgi:hypothetical protein
VHFLIFGEVHVAHICRVLFIVLCPLVTEYLSLSTVLNSGAFSFEIYIFRKGQLDREHDRIIVLVMTSTWVQRSLV